MSLQFGHHTLTSYLEPTLLCLQSANLLQSVSLSNFPSGSIQVYFTLLPHLVHLYSPKMLLILIFPLSHIILKICNFMLRLHQRIPLEIPRDFGGVPIGFTFSNTLFNDFIHLVIWGVYHRQRGYISNQIMHCGVYGVQI